MCIARRIEHLLIKINRKIIINEQRIGPTESRILELIIGFFCNYFRYWKGILCKGYFGEKKGYWEILCHESVEKKEDRIQLTGKACEN